MVGKTVTIMFQEYWKINVCVLDLTMLSCCYIGKIVVGVLPNATEDQRVGSEVEDACVRYIFEDENILSGGEL